MFVGVGASRVRDIFRTAKDKLHAFFLSMKLTQSAGSEALGLAEAPKSASRPSIRSSVKWMASCKPKP